MDNEQLREVRKRIGFSQRQMASVLKIGLRTYNRYERGHREIPGVLEPATRWVEHQYKPSLYLSQGC